MHSLTEMGFSEANPGILGPVWDWSDRIGTGSSRLGPVNPDWNWSIQIGTGRLVQDWFGSEYCPSSEIPGQKKRPPNKYCCFIFSNIYINIGFYVHRNVVGNES